MTTDRAQSTVLNGLLIICGDAYSAKQPVDIIRPSACTLLQRLLSTIDIFRYGSFDTSVSYTHLTLPTTPYV